MKKMLVKIPTEITTPRLIIRKYRESDGKALFDLLERNNNREHLKEHVNEASSIKTEEEAEIRIRKFIAYWVARKSFILGIWLKASKRYIGQIWIEPKKWNVPSFELGWYLDQTYQGEGLATEAVKRSIRLLFDDLNTHKIIVLTRDNNERSIKLTERCGFIREGHLRDHNIENGKRFGLLCYRMLRSEYSQTNGPEKKGDSQT
ncbi:MAG: GNAT family N-acetyltransferase [Candidatus Hodarchaeales archaeon]|jgi:RimJ/RimL family protein N-acetyltransferase